MLKLSAIILFTIIVGTVSGFLSDGVKEFMFTRGKNDSEKFDFEYKLDNGSIFRGRAHRLNFDYVHVYLMVGADDIIYWVKIDDFDLENDKPFSKIVRLVQRNNDELFFKDDFREYQLSLLTGDLSRVPYGTEWDLEKICFTKTNNESQTFQYVIVSKNNSRKEKGETEIENAGDPHLHRVRLHDEGNFDGIYEMKFTEKELNCNSTFCKGISATIHIEYIPAAPLPMFTKEIDQNLLKSLIG